MLKYIYYDQIEENFMVNKNIEYESALRIPKKKGIYWSQIATENEIFLISCKNN